MKFYLACIALIAVFCSVKAQGKKASTSAAIIKPNATVKPSISVPLVTQSSHKPSLNPISIKTISPSNTNIPSNTVTAHPTMKPNSTAHPTMKPNNTVHPSMYPKSTGTVQPTMKPNNTVSSNTTIPAMNSTYNPNATSHVSSKTTKIAHHSPSHSPSLPTKPTASPGKDDKDYDSVKKRMWIAAAFAIVFGLTTVILLYLVYRQRKINKELEGDPATSRLL
ncbi:circumsporozoite protein-like [Dendronephthya gigantea]|uniref:circumsporozoite protein-like n=1 Tax=Dendronephthya gigantea TaxID=151771 RepID=UPI00106BA045|nr:circumsporozoite protein-like [Dendronephthya gigantea]